MQKGISNEQRLTKRPKLRDASATPKASPIIVVASRHSPFTIPHSAFTIHEVPSCDTNPKNVLAKRTHLKLMHQKEKPECANEKRFRSRLGLPRFLPAPSQSRF